MDKINMKHIMFIIWGTTIVSTKTNITTLIALSGRDTWIAIGIASLIIFLFIGYMTNVMKNTNSYNVVEIYRGALGKTVGNTFITIVLISLVLMLTECSSVEASTVHINLFLETPTWYLIVFFAIPAIYTVRKGLTPTIIVTIIGICLAILAGINLVILTSKYKDYNYLLPIMAENLNIKFIYSILLTLGFYGGIFLLFPFLKYVNDKNKIKKFSLIGFLFVTQMHLVSSIGVIAAFGPQRASNLIYPKLIQTQEISILGFIESGEFFVLFQTVGGWYVKYVLCFFVIRELLRGFNIDNNIIVYTITLIVAILSYFLSKDFMRLYEALYIYGYISLVNLIIIPFIVFTIYKIRYKKKAENQNNA